MTLFDWLIILLILIVILKITKVISKMFFKVASIVMACMLLARLWTMMQMW